MKHLRGLKIFLTTGEIVNLGVGYSKVKLHNKDYFKIRVPEVNPWNFKRFVSKITGSICTLNYVYLSPDYVMIKEGVSTEDL